MVNIDESYRVRLLFFFLKSQGPASKSTMGGSPGELSEELVTYEKRKKRWRMNCDVCEAPEGLENELWRR